MSRSPFIDHHDTAWDAHTSALFSERCQLYGEEWRGRRAASDTFPRLRDMASSPPRIRHSSENLPPLSLLAALRRDMQVNAGISFSPKMGHIHNLICCKDLRNSQNSKKTSILFSPRRLPATGHNAKFRMYSSPFPEGHQLNQDFVQTYQLEDELGSGGYGFVMTAYHRTEGHEVAVKFIIKDKVPEHGWMEDDVVGRLPTEVVLLSFIQHDNVVKCLDLFEDLLYFYLVSGQICKASPCLIAVLGSRIAWFSLAQTPQDKLSISAN